MQIAVCAVDAFSTVSGVTEVGIDLPYVDEHAVRIDAPRALVWSALQQYVDTMLHSAEHNPLVARPRAPRRFPRRRKHRTSATQPGRPASLLALATRLRTRRPTRGRHAPAGPVLRGFPRTPRPHLSCPSHRNASSRCRHEPHAGLDPASRPERRESLTRYMRRGRSNRSTDHPAAQCISTELIPPPTARKIN